MFDKELLLTHMKNGILNKENLKEQSIRRMEALAKRGNTTLQNIQNMPSELMAGSSTKEIFSKTPIVQSIETAAVRAIPRGLETTNISYGKTMTLPKGRTPTYVTEPDNPLQGTSQIKHVEKGNTTVLHPDGSRGTLAGREDRTVQYIDQQHNEKNNHIALAASEPHNAHIHISNAQQSLANIRRAKGNLNRAREAATSLDRLDSTYNFTV